MNFCNKPILPHWC